ncbi:MAG: class I SAM-dependent methyltransferase [Eggerthellaceae bacterium]|jgi:ubiquinone/menaquinone biosynthesis C-methylase UbiE
MADRYLQNACKPEGEFGAQVLHKMNEHHRGLVDWAFEQVLVPADAHALDVGCGGGANIARLLDACPAGKVTGVDYSLTSVEESCKLNSTAIDAGRCTVVQADVAALPFPDRAFDFVLACETVYFWPDLDAALSQVHRVMRPEATFLTVCEMSDPNDARFAGTSGFLTIYQPDELQQRYRKAGFSQVGLHAKGEWYCLTARRVAE